MTAEPIDAQPGFRRRFIVTPEPGRVTAAVEDDYHCMAVTLHHDGVMVTAVDPVMDRVPWTTCPGAPAVLQRTFVGASLGDAAAQGQKQANCTHLYDLAVLAAPHAHDDVPTIYDILVCDAVDGVVTAEIRRNGAVVHRLTHRDDNVVTPEALAGTSLFKLRGWIESLDGLEREGARLLQWGTILAHGRAIPMDRQSDATKIPPNCYTFQPENKVKAVRVGRVIDFSQGRLSPLDHFADGKFSPQPRQMSGEVAPD